MKKIMFVCHGNICRSPMAEFVLKKMLSEKNFENDVFVASSATHTDEIGSGVYPPARRMLASHGIGCDGKKAVLLRKDDYDKYDLFLGMDSANIRNMHRIFGSDPEGKIKKLLDYSGGGDVADPWYTGDFDTTYQDIYNACINLVKEIEKNV